MYTNIHIFWEMLNRVVVGLFRSKMEVKSSKSVCRGIFLFLPLQTGCLCFGLCGPHQCSADTGADTWQKQALYYMPFLILFFTFEWCVDSPKIFLPSFKTVRHSWRDFFSKRVTVDDVPRKTFFFAPLGQYTSSTFRDVAMEYRSMPTHVAVHFLSAGRTLLDRELCNNVSILASTSKRLSLFLRTFLPDRIVAVRPFFKVKEQLLNQIFCGLIFSVRNVSVALESFEFSLTVGDRVAVRRRGKSACTWRFLPC